jgi:methylated-DNA-[protein]-cysteine S-methyltransferase
MTETTLDTSTTWASFESPLGTFTLTGDGSTLQRLYFPSEAGDFAAGELAAREPDETAFAEARAQLEAYFAGELRSFALALAPRGSELQQRVWRALQQIAYGETTTYGAIAAELGVSGSEHDPPARIVGAAVARTPIPIILPCHRVVASDGALRGYRGGLELKRALLDFEATGGLREALEPGWQRDQLSLL